MSTNKIIKEGLKTYISLILENQIAPSKEQETITKPSPVKPEVKPERKRTLNPDKDKRTEPKGLYENTYDTTSLYKFLKDALYDYGVEDYAELAMKLEECLSNVYDIKIKQMNEVDDTFLAKVGKKYNDAKK